MATKVTTLTMLAALILTGCQGVNDFADEPETIRPTITPISSPAPTLQGTQTMQETILGLAAMGIPLRCTFEQETEENTLTGTVYAANGKFFVDGTIDARNGDSKLYFAALSDGMDVYQWSDFSDQGLRINQETLFEAGENIRDLSRDNSQFGAMTQLLSEVEYTCENWTVDERRFDLPEGVQFTNITGLVNSLNSVNR